MQERALRGIYRLVAAAVVPAAVLASTAPPATASETHIVNQVDLTFVPEEITVAPGDTIRWIWSSGFHTVTSGTPCVPDDMFFNGPLTSSFPVFEYTVATDFEGEIPYLCIPHCNLAMLGNIIVQSGAACPEDLDGSGFVDFADILVVLTEWGPCPPEGECPADLDGGGEVDFADILILLGSWGPCP